MSISKKDGGRSRAWLLTVPASKWTAEDLKEAFSHYSGVAVVGQLERGEKSGFEHWQLYAEFSSPVRFSALKKRLPSVHLERRRGTRAEAVAYCTKISTRVEGSDPFVVGVMPTEVSGRSVPDFEALRSLIVDDGRTAADLIVNEPNAWRYAHQLRELEMASRALRDDWFKTNNREVVDVFYLYGPGRVGKTFWALENARSAGRSVYRVNNYLHPFDDYNGEDVLILDEFRSSLSLDVVLNLLDVYPFMMPARYRNRVACFTEVWVISNQHFRQQYPNVFREDHASWVAFYKRFKAIYKMETRGVLSPELPFDISPSKRFAVVDGVEEEELPLVSGTGPA